MDGHDIGRGRDGPTAALRALAAGGTRLLGVGIKGDILYGPDQVRVLVAAAREAGANATYADVGSTKGHDAFLVEWGQLSILLRAALATF